MEKYKCSRCGKEFEADSFKSDGQFSCPFCFFGVGRLVESGDKNPGITRKIEVNTFELAKLIMANSNAQLSGCYISANIDGDLYFAQPAEIVGPDDVVVFSFKTGDHNFGDSNDDDDVCDMAEWIDAIARAGHMPGVELI